MYKCSTEKLEKLWNSTGIGSTGMNSWVLQINGQLCTVIGVHVFIVNTHIYFPDLSEGMLEEHWHLSSNEQSECPDLGFQMLFSTRRILGSLQKWLVLKLEQEKYKINLELLFLPDDKEALKKGWGHVKRIQKSALRGSHWPNLGQCDHWKNTDGNKGIQHTSPQH